MLKYTNQKVIEVGDWDSLVQKTYGKPYSFQQQDGCKDRGTFYINIPDICSDHEMPDSISEKINGNEMGVKFSSWLVRNPEEWNGDPEKVMFLDIFWERHFYPDIQMIANDLHEKGLIEAGNYTINIDW